MFGKVNNMLSIFLSYFCELFQYSTHLYIQYSDSPGYIINISLDIPHSHSLLSNILFYKKYKYSHYSWSKHCNLGKDSCMQHIKSFVKHSARGRGIQYHWNIYNQPKGQASKIYHLGNSLDNKICKMMVVLFHMLSKEISMGYRMSRLRIRCIQINKTNIRYSIAAWSKCYIFKGKVHNTNIC